MTTLRMQSINKIQSAMTPNSTEIEVQCHMTEGQMREALNQFLERITWETWQQWVKEIDEETV